MPALRFLALIGLTALAGCAEAVPPATPSDMCGAASLQGLVGQPRSVLATMRPPVADRIIGPGDAVTADFRPDRLNIEIGAGGRIEKVACY